jgi:hypothetical protein
MSKDLLQVIDEFLAERKISDYRFSKLATGNGRLMERLRDTEKNRRVWPETEMRIRAFIMTERNRQSRKQRGVA